MQPKACTRALQGHSLAYFWEVQVVTVPTLQGRARPCILCVGSLLLEGQGCWHKERWSLPAWLSPVPHWREEHVHVAATGTAPSGPACWTPAGTPAALHLPVGPQINKSELPLYDLNYFLTTLTTSLLSCIFNAIVEFYFFFLCILMREVLIQKQLSSQIIKTLIFGILYPRNGVQSMVKIPYTLKNVLWYYAHRYYGAARGDA